MEGTVLLIDGSPERRRALRLALERRGHVVAGEAGSVPEIVDAVATLTAAPQTVLVGASLVDRTSDGIGELLKRTWPKATIIQETADAPVSISQARRVAAVAGA